MAAHRERWDGKGYPAQMVDRQIPLLARILAVADAFSAMITTDPTTPLSTHGKRWTSS